MHILHIFTAIVVCACVPTNALHVKTDRARPYTFVSDANVSFTSFFCCNETDKMKHVLTSIKSMHFCFRDVILFVDVPHGGVLHAGQRRTSLSGGPGGYSGFLNQSWGQHMISVAENVAREAVNLLQSNCPLSHRPTWSVDVMNYDDPAMLSIFDSDFDVSAPIPSNGFVFDSMYANTMVYAKMWHDTGAQYVWHQDSSAAMACQQDSTTPFIETSVALMRSDDRVIFTRPTEVNASGLPAWSPGHSRIHDFDAKWPEGSLRAPTWIYIDGPNPLYYPHVTGNMFLMDVQKFRSILPMHLDFITDSAEYFFRHNFREHGVWPVTVGVGPSQT